MSDETSTVRPGTPTGSMDPSVADFASEDYYKIAHSDLQNDVVESERDDQLTDAKYSGIWNSSHSGVTKKYGLTTAVTLRTPPSGAYEERDSWEGIVLSRSGDQVRVRLVDPQRARNDEEAEFSLSDLPQFDRDLVKPGAPFHWTVGAWTSEVGSRCLVSQIRFQRLPNLSAIDLEKAAEEAAGLRDLFDGA